MSTAGLLTRPPAPVVLHPRHDPSFVDRILDDLTDHRGAWRQLGRLYAAHIPSFDRCCVVREAVDWARKLGMVVEADRRRGYRFVGHRHPERLYLVKPGGESRTEPETQVPGQLTLAAEV